LFSFGGVFDEHDISDIDSIPIFMCPFYAAFLDNLSLTVNSRLCVRS
jgi:hypothetical protein